MDSPALVSPQSKMPNKAKSGAKTGQQRRPKDGRAPPSDLGSREPLKSGLSGKKGAPDSDLGASKTSKRDKPRTFRELLAESQGPVQELEKEREARTNRDELEKLMRDYRTHGHRESPTEVVTRKREIFLLQYSLDAKRAEIQRLREAAAKEEEELKKEEADLEKAALEFDGFLEDNDRKAMDALRQAEQETKLKLAKAKEIKKLQLALISLRSEISKSEEQLRDSLRCRKLLELLTPRDWLEQHVYQPRRERKAERDRIAAQALAAAAAESSQSTQNALLAGRRMSKVAPNLRNTIKTITNGIRQVRIASISGPSAAAAGDDANGARTAGSGTGGKVPSRRGSLAMHRRSSASMTAGAKGSTDSSLANKKATNESDAAPAQPVNDDPLAEISIDDPDAFDLEAVLAKLQDFEGDVEIPIYFTEPEQLLREFEKLDKENVELERLCKEEEEKVHRLEKDLEAEVIKAEREKDARKAEIAVLSADVAREKEGLAVVQKQHASLLASLAEDQEQMLDELSRKVAELYLACCPARPDRADDFGMGDAAPLSTAEMLTAITQQLNTMLDTLGNVDPSVLKAAKDALIKERARLNRIKTPKR